MFFIGVLMVILFFLWIVLFALGLVCILVYILFRCYQWIERLQAPEGKRIQHRRLKGYLEGTYGTTEGKSLYKEIIETLKKDGYR